MKPPPFPARARLGGAGNAGCNPDGNPFAIESRPWLAARRRALAGGAQADCVRPPRPSNDRVSEFEWPRGEVKTNPRERPKITDRSPSMNFERLV